MLEASIGKFTYDSANRLTAAGTRYYTYDVEGTRIKTQKGEDTTEFVYNVNARLSQLLIKTENNAVTKYVYGLGLIGEEISGNFKTYHFDYRGSTVAIMNANGTVTDTFEYDTYGKLTARTGTTKTPFLYNGRDGVMYEDDTGLYYMRARYYSTALRRFVNADKLHGDISNSLTLNRYSFCNGDPVSYVDPFGLSSDNARGNQSNNSMEHESNRALFVVDFSFQTGLPIFGHALIYFQRTDGQWYITEFAGSNKRNAKVSCYSVSKEYMKKELERVKDRQKLLCTDGIDYVELSGDFSDSLALAQEYDKNQSFPSYNLFENNCLHYVQELLSKAEIDNPLCQRYIDNSESFIPKQYMNALKDYSEYRYLEDFDQPLVFPPELVAAH